MHHALPGTGSVPDTPSDDVSGGPLKHPAATADQPDIRPESQPEAVTMLMDQCTDAVAALKKHQKQCAALTVFFIDRLPTFGTIGGSSESRV